MKRFSGLRPSRLALIAMTLIGTLSGTSCSGSSSRLVETADLFVELIATTASTGRTAVDATLRLTGPNSLNFVDLRAGDALRATLIDPNTLAEDEQTMVRPFGIGNEAVPYSIAFAKGEKDTGIEVAFDRTGSGRISAINSFVTLPVPFMLDWVDDPGAMTAAPNPFSRSSAAPYYVVWDPFDAPDFDPGDELRYAITGTCIQPLEGTIDWQSGEYALQLTGVLQDPAPPNDGLSCQLRLTFSLRRAGVVDPAFAGGSFIGEQLRFMTLQSTP